MHTISLPESLHFAVEHLAARGGFESAAEYIADLVRRDVELNPPEPSPPLRQIVEEANGRTLTDPEWERCTRKIESLLIEGLDSGPAVEMTAEDWADMRRRVDGRLVRKEP
jgi:antitoxin ParD1/3/4